jgi:hypothetical protein
VGPTVLANTGTDFLLSWKTFAIAGLAYRFGPSLVLRLVTSCYPRDSVRRDELTGEFQALHQWQRLRFVLELVELGVCEGLVVRWANRDLKRLFFSLATKVLLAAQFVVLAVGINIVQLLLASVIFEPEWANGSMLLAVVVLTVCCYLVTGRVRRLVAARSPKRQSTSSMRANPPS